MMQPISRLLGVKLLGVLAICYAIIVTILMLIPTKGISKIHIPFFDKIVHSVIYIGFVFIWLWYFSKKGNTKGKHFFFIPLALFIYGIVIEILQGNFVPSRTQDVWDVAANSLGILIGWIFFYKLKDKFLLKN